MELTGDKYNSQQLVSQHPWILCTVNTVVYPPYQNHDMMRLISVG